MINARHLFDRFTKIFYQLFLSDAAKCIKCRRHTNIFWLVETAEHANLRELRYACQEDKLEVCISCLESRIESLQGIAVVLLQGYFGTLKGYLVVKIHHIKEWLVVFIYQHNGTETSLAMDFIEQIDKA